MPWTDLQFWLVTASAMVSVWVLVRPWLKRSNGPVCGSCASGAAACAQAANQDVAHQDRDRDAALVVIGQG